MGPPGGDEFRGSLVVQSLVRSDGVIDMLPVLEFAIESRELQGAGGDFIELLGMGAVGAFDGAVEFWGSRRENEQTKSASLAGLFKQGLEFTAAIDLDGADGKRCTGRQSI